MSERPNAEVQPDSREYDTIQISTVIHSKINVKGHVMYEKLSADER